mgnify:CR=1 FL=1
MTTSTNPDFNSNDLARRLITNLTNFSNAVARLTRQQREDKNFIVDEMCRHKKEYEQLIKSQKKYLKNIEDAITMVLLHQQKLMGVLECIVHHYNLKDQEN